MGRQLSGGGRYYDDDDDDASARMLDDDGWRPQASCAAGGHCACLLALGAAVLAFTVLLLYALAAADRDAVNSACPSLWTFMLLRCVAAFLFSGLMACVRARAGAGAGDGNDGGNPVTVRDVVVWGLAFGYFACFATAGGIIVSKSMIGNGACTTLLSSSSFTGTPLLGTLGWVNLSADAAVSAGLIVVALLEVRKDLALQGYSDPNDGIV